MCGNGALAHGVCVGGVFECVALDATRAAASGAGAVFALTPLHRPNIPITSTAPALVTLVKIHSATGKVAFSAVLHVTPRAITTLLHSADASSRWAATTTDAATHVILTTTANDGAMTSRVAQLTHGASAADINPVTTRTGPAIALDGTRRTRMAHVSIVHAGKFQT
jgi:hypothetical protein